MPQGESKVDHIVEITDNVYVRVYPDNHLELVGRNVKLDIVKQPSGAGHGDRWQYGESWHIKVEPVPGTNAAKAIAPGSGQPSEDVSGGQP